MEKNLANNLSNKQPDNLNWGIEKAPQIPNRLENASNYTIRRKCALPPCGIFILAFSFPVPPKRDERERETPFNWKLWQIPDKNKLPKYFLYFYDS